ncbi:MAG: hypothetical protein JW973_06960 [Bacteroidales bacterium]|nr:hypothetical protein [Bacteroidales bacterium]
MQNESLSFRRGAGVRCPDPYIQDPTVSQCFNRYGYCLFNPLKYVDPRGYLVNPGFKNDVWYSIERLWNSTDAGEDWMYTNGGGGNWCGQRISGLYDNGFTFYGGGGGGNHEKIISMPTNVLQPKHNSFLGWILKVLGIGDNRGWYQRVVFDGTGDGFISNLISSGTMIDMMYLGGPYMQGVKYSQYLYYLKRHNSGTAPDWMENVYGSWTEAYSISLYPLSKKCNVSIDFDKHYYLGTNALNAKVYATGLVPPDLSVNLQWKGSNLIFNSYDDIEIDLKDLMINKITHEVNGIIRCFSAGHDEMQGFSAGFLTINYQILR